jgi:8-oxo-dGTP pyrophosphatase MutT (NUDIX family)
MTVHYADAWVVNQRRELLMVYNLKLSLWLPPGGKMEYGETPYEAAIRELREETAIHENLLTPVDVIANAPNRVYRNQLPTYVDTILGNRAVVHNFAFRLRRDVAIAINDESGEYKWNPIDEYYGVSPHNVVWTAGHLDALLTQGGGR